MDTKEDKGSNCRHNTQLSNRKHVSEAEEFKVERYNLLNMYASAQHWKYHCNMETRLYG